MKKPICQVVLFMSLIALTGCNHSTPAPAPAPAQNGVVSTPSTVTPKNTAGPSIDDQMKDLKEHNGDIPQQERDRLNNVPVIPDVFDK
jgi:hypothetical protein